MSRKLDIGATHTAPVAPDFETDCPPTDYHVLWGQQPLPFADATFDEVYTSHTLEHVPWFQTGCYAS